jgi:hypothetical protein
MIRCGRSPSVMSGLASSVISLPLPGQSRRSQQINEPVGQVGNCVFAIDDRSHRSSSRPRRTRPSSTVDGGTSRAFYRYVTICHLDTSKGSRQIKDRAARRVPAGRSCRRRARGSIVRCALHARGRQCSELGITWGPRGAEEGRERVPGGADRRGVAMQVALRANGVILAGGCVRTRRRQASWLSSEPSIRPPFRRRRTRRLSRSEPQSRRPPPRAAGTRSTSCPCTSVRKVRRSRIGG